MKMMIKQLALIMTALLLMALSAPAQTFTTLCTFTNLYEQISGLVSSGNTLYGMLNEGGTSGEGSIFSINTDGTGFTNIYSFSGSDGANPSGNLTISGNTLYGTTRAGGSWNDGTIFAISTNGAGFTNLYSFSGANYDLATDAETNSDGASPDGGLILSGNTLYGTAPRGGASGYGTLFSISIDGAGFTNIHSFTGEGYNVALVSTNYDGARPNAGLALSGNTLYGTAETGGNNGIGTVFSINTNGTSFTVVHNFSGGDGAYPNGGLIISGNSLYGTAAGGGSLGEGQVFSFNTNGSGFTILYSFTAMAAVGTNSDGAYPNGELIASGNTLYGTTVDGGSWGEGTMFRINTNGTGFTNLFNFTDAYTGIPDSASTTRSGMTLLGDTFYGTESYLYFYQGTNGTFGGMSWGDVFALTLLNPIPIPLNLQADGGNVVLTWGNPAFSLQAAPTVSGVWTNVPGAASPCTNAMTGPQMFFRLQAN
jgi:uncharacterized repeat protein (TIGR03803 family)